MLVFRKDKIIFLYNKQNNHKDNVPYEPRPTGMGGRTMLYHPGLRY